MNELNRRHATAVAAKIWHPTGSVEQVTCYIGHQPVEQPAVIYDCWATNLRTQTLLAQPRISQAALTITREFKQTNMRELLRRQ